VQPTKAGQFSQRRCSRLAPASSESRDRGQSELRLAQSDAPELKRVPAMPPRGRPVESIGLLLSEQDAEARRVDKPDRHGKLMRRGNRSDEVAANASRSGISDTRRKSWPGTST
jgi:hypothetical protein